MDKIEADSSKAVKLLPCPFCSSSDVRMHHGRDENGDYIAQCEGCGAFSCPHGTRFDKDIATEDWNTRKPNPAAIDAVVEALEAQERLLEIEGLRCDLVEARSKGRFGIAIAKDDEALEYQRLGDELDQLVRKSRAALKAIKEEQP